MRNTLLLFTSLFIGCALVHTEASVENNYNINTLLENLLDTGVEASTRSLRHQSCQNVAKLACNIRNSAQRQVRRSSKLHELFQTFGQLQYPSHWGSPPQNKLNADHEAGAVRAKGEPRKVTATSLGLGDWVEVQVLDEDESSTGEWLLAHITTLRLDGRFDLAFPDGTPVKPALESGIRRHHLRAASHGQVTAAKTKLAAKAEAATLLKAAQNDVAKQEAAMKELLNKVRGAKERTAKANFRVRRNLGNLAPKAMPKGFRTLRRTGCKVPGMP